MTRSPHEPKNSIVDWYSSYKFKVSWSRKDLFEEPISVTSHKVRLTFLLYFIKSFIKANGVEYIYNFKSSSWKYISGPYVSRYADVVDYVLSNVSYVANRKH